MQEEKPKSNILKNTLIFGALIGSLYIGDVFKPFERLAENSFYHHSSVEDGFYQRPRNLSLETVRNEKNRIEIYLVDNSLGDSLPVRENMHVGTFGKSIDDYLDGKKEETQSWWQKQMGDSTSFMYKLKHKF